MAGHYSLLSFPFTHYPPINMKTLKIYPLLFIILTLSCVSKQKYDELQKKFDRIDAQNTQLKEQLVRQYENRIPTPPPTYNYQDEMVVLPSYAFVVLDVEEITKRSLENGIWQETWGKFTSTSQIKEFRPFTEEAKYIFLDEVVASYKQANAGPPKDGKVLKRECLSFKTYEEASKEREKYILQ